jgi:dTDP-4-amino-4,6-dideoxygalactose transaminase
VNSIEGRELLAVEGGRPTREDFLVFGAPLIEDDDITEVVDTLRSGWVSTGPKTKQFEREVGEYVGAAHAVATNSCTAAMHLALLASGIGSGDEVILPSMTFAATANVVEHVGARPVFADSVSDGFNIDPAEIRTRITSRTRAIIVVHFAGFPCAMDEIHDIAREYGLLIIEDAAHAIGTEYHGKRIGGLGDLTAFSFYVTKNICTAEGGMVVTNDAALAERLRVLSLHGMDIGAWQRYAKHGRQHYEIVVPGFKYNMTDIAAALGLCQLRKLDRFIKARQEYARILTAEMSVLDELILPRESSEHRCAWHLYPVMVRPERLRADRDGVMTALIAENIGIGVHFRPLHLHPFYRKRYGYRTGMLPRAEFIGERVFSLPLSPKLTLDDVRSIVRAVRKVIRHYRA